VATAVEMPANRGDAEFARLFVGTWMSGSRSEGPSAAFAATTYFADGTFQLVLYDESCKGIKHEAGGTWQIKDKEVYMETRTSVGSQEQRLRPGTGTRDKIVSVDSRKMVLLNAAGHLLHRTKGQPCPRK